MPKYYTKCPCCDNPYASIDRINLRKAITREQIQKVVLGLINKWDSTILHTSTPRAELDNWYMREIISAGIGAVPVILKELQRKPSHLYLTLSPITEENPVEEKDYGFLDRACDAWIKWGEERGYI